MKLPETREDCSTLEGWVGHLPEERDGVGVLTSEVRPQADGKQGGMQA